MKFGKVLLVLAVAATPIPAETIHGVTVFSRHGDRTSKHYPGYSLTSLGFQQNFQVGDDYRSRYLRVNASQRILGISGDLYVPSQIYASAPDQMVLLNAATAFLQGLYPPLAEISPSIAWQRLNNGSTYANPLNGYQYVVLHGQDADSPDTIWMKGDDGCPAHIVAADTFKYSQEAIQRSQKTKPFYDSFWDILHDVYDYRPENMSYLNAYDIFDLINVATVHNSSIMLNVTAEQLFQLRTLADSAEFDRNYNKSQPLRSIGGQTLAGAILKQLNQTINSKGELKFSLLVGSYDTFLSFFGLSNLTAANPNFYGLPGYASTMAFELVTEQTMTTFPTDLDDLHVRFLFRNGSNPPSAFPLFGRTEPTISWKDFTTEMEARAVTSLGQWCKMCSSREEFCIPYVSTDPVSPLVSSQSRRISKPVAGVIGAVVALAVVGLAGGLAFWLHRRKIRNNALAGQRNSMPFTPLTLSLSFLHDK